MQTMTSIYTLQEVSINNLDWKGHAAHGRFLRLPGDQALWEVLQLLALCFSVEGAHETLLWQALLHRTIDERSRMSCRCYAAALMEDRRYSISAPFGYGFKGALLT